MRPLCVPVLSAVVMLAQSWSGGQSSPRLLDTGGCNDPNVQLPRAPRARRGPADPNARNIDTLVIKWKRTTRIPKQPQPPTAEELHRLTRSEEHTSELQSPCNLVCRLLLEKKKSMTI